MIRAALFDLGGTLYDYKTLERGDRENLVALARWARVEASPEQITAAYRESMRSVFARRLSQPYYLHRDLFRDAVAGMLARLGGELTEAHNERYRERVQAGHRRDFELREGVLETLRTLRERGLRLGIVSNIDEDQLSYLTELGGLKDHFDWMLSSEKAGSCKPHRGIFEASLERAGCAADEALFIGDTLRQDIVGANEVGMHSVLLWHRDDREPPGPIQPRHVIRRIPDLLFLLDRAC